MTTEWLSEWEIAAIAQSVERNLAGLHPRQGRELLAKLERASHVRLSYRDAVATAEGR